MAVSVRRIDSFRTLLAQAMSEAVADLPALKFNDDPQQLAVAAIYATILQSTDECLLLLNRSSVTSVGSIIRSMLESFADLCAVIAEPTYVERMLATFEDQKLRLLKNMSRSRSDEFYKDLAGQLDVEAMKSQVSTALSEYRSRGHQALSNAERFREADLIYIYESLYWHLCLSGHNDISSLERRHIRVSDGSVELIMLRENDLQEVAIYLEALLAIVSDGSLRVHRLVASPRVRHYEQRASELLAFRKAAI